MNASTQRRKGSERRPTMGPLTRAGLARLPEIIPASLAIESPEIRAALLFCQRVAAWNANAHANAQREKAAALTAAHRAAHKTAK